MFKVDNTKLDMFKILNSIILEKKKKKKTKIAIEM